MPSIEKTKSKRKLRLQFCCTAVNEYDTNESTKHSQKKTTKISVTSSIGRKETMHLPTVQDLSTSNSL
jgi:hypothetical protein